jgi:hypothetical protein
MRVDHPVLMRQSLVQLSALREAPRSRLGADLPCRGSGHRKSRGRYRLRHDIAVFGGSCLILASDIRGASGDVDAVFLAGGPAVYEISAQVAREMGLTDDWLNEGVKHYAYPPGNPGPNILPFDDYPRDGTSAVGLRVFLPMPQYMLAMKMLANRFEDDIDKIKSDIADAVGLMKVAKITTKEALVALMKECYPGIHAYANAIEEPDPTWNAGTGPATRKI